MAHTVMIQSLTFVLRPAATYRAVEAGLDTRWVAVLATAFAVVPLVLAIPVGILTDRMGEKAVMQLGAALTLVSAGLFVLVGLSVAGILAATAILGTGHLFATVGQHSYVARRSARADYDRGFGHYGLAVSFGQVIGPALLVLFPGEGHLPDTEAIFLCSVGIGAVALVLASALPGRVAAALPSTVAVLSTGQLMGARGMVRGILVGSLLLAAIDISLVYVPVLGESRGISAGVVGALLAARAISSMASRVVMGPLLALLGARHLLVAGTIGSALGLALVALPLATPGVLAGMILLGFGFGVAQPLTMSWVAHLAPLGSQGRAMSMRLTGNRLGQVSVPLVVGSLVSGGGAGAVMWVTSVVVVGAGFIGRGMPEGPQGS